MKIDNYSISNSNSNNFFPANLGKKLKPSDSFKPYVRVFPYRISNEKKLHSFVPKNYFESAVQKCVKICINESGFLELIGLGISLDPSWNDGGWCSLHRFFKHTLHITPLRNFNFATYLDPRSDNETNSDFEEDFDYERNFDSGEDSDLEENTYSSIDSRIPTFCSKLKEERALFNLNLKETNVKVVNTAYKKLALKHHPDKGGELEIFKKIAIAYEKIRKELESYLNGNRL